VNKQAMFFTQGPKPAPMEALFYKAKTFTENSRTSPSLE
jgi:hypothetical protein